LSCMNMHEGMYALISSRITSSICTYSKDISYISFCIFSSGICFSDFSALKVDHPHSSLWFLVCFYQETEGDNIQNCRLVFYVILTVLVAVSVQYMLP
jgi:hypothetical protein